MNTIKSILLSKSLSVASPKPEHGLGLTADKTLLYWYLRNFCYSQSRQPRYAHVMWAAYFLHCFTDLVKKNIISRQKNASKF